MSPDAVMVNFELTQGLQRAYKSMIMPFIGRGGVFKMSKSAEEILTAGEKDAVLDPFSDPEAFKSLWMKGAALAHRKAVEENNLFGVDSPGTIDGRLAVKTPSGEVRIAKHFYM